MIYTSDPFTDYIIYWTKYMAMNSIYKNEEEAAKYETVEMAKAHEIYMICIEGRQTWGIWDSYPFEVLRTALRGVYTDNYIHNVFMDDVQQVPEMYRQRVADEMARVFLASYQETNGYYRSLCGMRPLESTLNVPLEEYGFENDLFLQNGISYTYLHELPVTVLQRIQSSGVLDRIMKAYPKEMWIQTIPKLIDTEDPLQYIRDCRRALNFEILYVPLNVDDNVRDQFIEKYDINRSYILSNVYSDAFKIGSDYYDNFIQILMIITTMVDMMDTASEHIAKRDIIEPRCIEYIFEQYGIPYYREIPLRYQEALMKNLNLLLKFKSTAKCMVDICSLFGFDSSQVFQLYLLRKRKVDDNGQYVFNYKTVEVPKKVGVVTSYATVIDIESINNEPILLSFPIPDYFEKGNKLEIWLDEELLPEEFYSIFDSYLTIDDQSVLKSHSQLRITYLYNETDDVYRDMPTYDILKKEETVHFDKTTKRYRLSPPTEDYFIDNNLFYVIYGTVLIPSTLYKVYPDSCTIEFSNEFFLEYSSEVNFFKIIYIYSDTIEVHHADIDVPCTEAWQTSFEIPEPFERYYESNSRFFISIGGTYIVADRYHVNGNTLIFNNTDDYPSPGQNVTFHFIYSKFNDIDLVDHTEKVYADHDHQVEFDIPVPYDSYFDDGNTVFIKIRGSYISPTYYRILKNRLMVDNNYSLYTNGFVEYHFVYGKTRAVKHEKAIVTATLNFQQDFRIPWPYEGFLAKNNRFRVYKDGEEYIEGVDYVVRGDILEILSVSKSLKEHETLDFDFFHTDSNATNITIKETTSAVLREGQRIFSIPVPFYNYFKTGNKIIVTVGSTFIPDEQYRISDGRIYFNDDATVDLSVGRNINYTFIYHSAFERYNQSIRIDSVGHPISDIEKGDNFIKVKIPWPFENYLDLGNQISVRVNGTHPIDEGDYEIVDDYAIIYDTEHTVYPYGNNIQFVFIYSCTGYESVVVEDLEKDIELKFVKVPILANPDPYLKDEKAHLDYESVISNDKSWTGDYTHETIKQALINKNFSYNRTKYFSLSSISSMGQIAYQLPYFMNMILDNVKLEERLTLKLPYINPLHSFRFNDVLTYMMALSHKFLGIDDDIPNVQRTLYIKGFNFEADMSAIADDLVKILGTHNILANMQVDPIWKEFKSYSYQIPSYKELIEIYTNNTKIYDTVVHQMLNAENKKMFDIYKKIYDSLMTVKESKAYFKINNRVASSLTEWIQYRDELLYQSLRDLDELEDADRQRTISKYIEDCVYQISEYINTDELRGVFNSFAGANTDSLLTYLGKVINFFKSYKVQMYDITTQYVFDDKLENTLRAIDQLVYTSNITMTDDGQTIFDMMYNLASSTYSDREIASTIREKIYQIVLNWLQLTPEERPTVLEYIKGMLMYMIMTDPIHIPEILSPTSTLTSTDRFEDLIEDVLSSMSKLGSIDAVSIKERYMHVIRNMLERTILDESSVIEELNQFLSSIYLEYNITQDISGSFTTNTWMTLYEIHASPSDRLMYYISTYYKELYEIEESYIILRKRIQRLRVSTSAMADIYDDLPLIKYSYAPFAYGLPIDKASLVQTLLTPSTNSMPIDEAIRLVKSTIKIHNLILDIGTTAVSMTPSTTISPTSSLTSIISTLIRQDYHLIESVHPTTLLDLTTIHKIIESHSTIFTRGLSIQDHAIIRDSLHLETIR